MCIYHHVRRMIVSILSVFGILASSAAWAQTAIEYQTTPALLGGNSSPPQILLSMSVDHQLFFKAYNDFDDITGDGIADITYSRDTLYIGYFDSYSCYQYANNQFAPVGRAGNHYYCNEGGTSGRWSGNFLNWATMTRIDVVRKILYGGYRSTDTTTATVLERSHLPNDAHSFAKYYNGTDLNKLTPYNLPSGQQSLNSGITLCNTTLDMRANISSQQSDRPPLVRVAKGNFTFWAAGERWQCLYREESTITGEAAFNSFPGVLSSIGVYAHHRSPSTSGDKIADLNVRIAACTAQSDLQAEECAQYPDGNYKPIGLLQKYGQDGAMHFGLMSGSYTKNKQGGVLRKNISAITDEINNANGTFLNRPADGGIITALSAFRISNWYAKADNSPEGTYFQDRCRWGSSEFYDGECTSWGNPFGEILLESYLYFAGANPTAAYAADDTFVSSNLAPITWQQPITAANHCANLNLLAFNSSTISFDGDSLDPTDIGSSFSELNAITTRLGAQEGIRGGKYFVGRTQGAADDELCTEKTVTSLASVRGTCPDAPRLKGSYYSSGLAFFAKTNDINNTIDGDQTVNTFGFSLAPAVPRVTVPRPNQPTKKITIFPACRNKSSKNTADRIEESNCAIVDFKIIEPHNDNDRDGTFTGAMYVTWEDSEQGGDFDQDVNGLIRYRLDPERLVVETRVLKASTGDELGFGFVVDGVSRATDYNGRTPIQRHGDGFHVMSGINGFDGGDCRNCYVSDDWKGKKFIVAAGNSEFLEQPLFYASKYGGFKDVNGNNLPDLVEEWDNKNNRTGAPGPDGIPDNYHNVNNPLDLKIQFDEALASILAGASSGSGSSVVTNAGDGEGLFVQSLFYPTLSHRGSELSWVSILNGLFMDELNNIRADSNSNGRLDDADDIISVVYDEPSKSMMAQAYYRNADGTRGAPRGGPISLHEVPTLWSAHTSLAKVTDPITQRSYVAPASTQRHILTALDTDGDGQITQATEQFDFTAATFATNNAFYLGVDATAAENIVNYIRGAEIAGFRSRTADIITSQAGNEVWRLGDIVNASPVIVGTPKSRYDTVYGDATYKAFRDHYANRRNVVYAAANDGMIHAFNAGFFDAQNTAYSGGNQELGSELWAYVPYNVLPHLRWLTDYNYPHVDYIDGSLQTFDVNIFADSAEYPGGWGTILVAGMRFGGGPITVTATNGDTRTMRSAWIVLDITNPERPPKVVAEITDANLGFTTTNAEVVKARLANSTNGNYDSPAKNQWYLAFGSGPYGNGAAGMRSAQTGATSTQSPRVYLFNLSSKVLSSSTIASPNSFIGGLRAADWNRDYIDDALYFGTVTGTADTSSGALHRGLLTFTNTSVTLASSNILETDQPFSAPPFTRIDNDYNYWVFAGSGRFFHDTDGLHAKQNSFYGVIEPLTINGQISQSAVLKTSLVNTSNIQTYTNGQVRTISGDPVILNTGEQVTSTAEVAQATKRHGGWYVDFPNTYARNVGPANMFASSLLFTAFTPTDDLCSGDVGNTRAYQREFFNGLSPTYSGVVNSGVTIGTGSDVGEAIPTTIDLGDSFFREVNEEGLTINSEGELTEVDLGSPKVENRRESWREVIKDW